MHLLFDLGCQAFEERPDLSGSLAVEWDSPLAPTLTGPADTPGRGCLAVGAENEATVGDIQFGLEPASSPPADITIDPDRRHHGERELDKTGLDWTELK